MTTLAAVLSAALSFGATALAARWLIPKFRRKGFAKTPVKKKGGDFVPGLPAPAEGGLPMAIGLGAGALLGFVILIITGAGTAAEVTVVLSARLLGGILLALLLGAIGLLDDIRRGRGFPGLSRPLTLLLQAGAGICYLLTLILCGDRSTILALPFLGQADLGVFYHPFCLLLILGAAAGGEQTASTDGTAATAAMVTGLSLGMAGGMLGSGPAPVLGLSLAGCALGLLLYSFPPAKLRCGRGGGMLFGGAAAAAAMGCGVPVLLLLAALPWLCEGVFALTGLFIFALTGKKRTAPSFGGWLEERGLSSKAVSAIFMAISFIGLILTVISALWL